MTSIIPENTAAENKSANYIAKFFKEYKVGQALKQSNFFKQKGFPCKDLLQFLVTLVFMGKNLWRYLDTDAGNAPFQKDAAYRFLNNCYYNWRKFLLLLSSQIIQNRIVPLTDEKRVNVFIIDDSLFGRSRSKAVELLARVYDHVEHKFVRGFRMLTLGWSDGNTFLPLSFSLLSSEKESNRLQGMNAVDKRTNGYKRRKEAIRKSTEVMLDLLKQAKAYMVPASYLLFDSWFSFPGVIRKVLEQELHIICMLKSVPTVKYEYQGQKLTLNKLYATVRKKRGRAKILASIIVGIGQMPNGESAQAKIVFVRDRRAKKKWLALLTTDIELSNEEVIRIYGKRWNIEVFFKMSKSYLRLAKEFQGRSYDSMVAHTSIVFIRYIMLALESRNGEDPRTIGNLFYVCCDELQDISLVDALQRLFFLIEQFLNEQLELADEEISKLLDYLISNLPSFFKERLAVCYCES
ncbi:MAG: IS4 family transposase [Dethiobacteria bacterium]|jgi:hypothetical protein